jgi:hypothetical protein
MERDKIVSALRRISAGERTMISGPVAVEVRGGHEWATNVTVAVDDAGGLLSWYGGHEHVNRINGPLAMVGDALHVPTDDHGIVIIRPIGPEDTWTVFPANVTAWEAVQRGLG